MFPTTDTAVTVIRASTEQTVKWTKYSASTRGVPDMADVCGSTRRTQNASVTSTLQVVNLFKIRNKLTCLQRIIYSKLKKMDTFVKFY